MLLTKETGGGVKGSALGLGKPSITRAFWRRALPEPLSKTQCVWGVSRNEDSPPCPSSTVWEERDPWARCRNRRDGRKTQARHPQNLRGSGRLWLMRLNPGLGGLRWKLMEMILLFSYSHTNKYLFRHLQRMFRPIVSHVCHKPWVCFIDEETES